MWPDGVTSFRTLKNDGVIKTSEMLRFLPFTNSSVSTELRLCY